MKKADFARYFINNLCEDNYADGNMCFYSGMRGGSAVFAAAHPTADSRGGIACEKILRVMADSFLSRPSLCDNAAYTLADFANKSVFALQEPYKTFFADAAVLFIRKGKARFVLSGNSRVYCLCGGKASVMSEKRSYALFGKSLRYKEEIPSEFSLYGETNAFAVVCGTGNADFDAEQLESSFKGISRAEEWAERLCKTRSEGDRLSIMTVILPKHKGIADFFARRGG